MIYGGAYYGSYYLYGVQASVQEPCVAYVPENTYDPNYADSEKVCALYDGSYQHDGVITYGGCTQGAVVAFVDCDPTEAEFTAETPLKVCV